MFSSQTTKTVPQASSNRNDGKQTASLSAPFSLVVAGTMLLSSLIGICLALSSRQLRADDAPSRNPQAPNGEFETPHDGIPWTEGEPECDPWDGQQIYCDVIGGNIVLMGTSDSESIWIETAPYDEDDPQYIVTINVIHSDLSFEWYEFTGPEIMNSAGIFDYESMEAYLFRPLLFIDMGCGDDTVVNRITWDSTVKLGAGDDAYFGGMGEDTVEGEWGNDLIFGGRGVDQILGGPGADKLFGGSDAPGIVLWPGVVQWGSFPANYIGASYDGKRDDIDCGQDSDADWVYPESKETEDGLVLMIDSLINVDWNSPPGTDHVN